MKHPIRYALTLAAFVGVGIHAENTPPGYVDFGKFSPPSSGGEFVEVHITSNLISMVARLAEKNEPEIAELLRGLHRVRVNVIGLDDGNRAEMETRVKKIRSDLDAQEAALVVRALIDGLSIDWLFRDDEPFDHFRRRLHEAVFGYLGA